tara:strand:- start:58 stop:495 length:438 start_codon:yes stop_codon:yes gene_type:complete
MNYSNKLNCFITAGVNTCGICYNKAFFSTSIPPKRHETLRNMELFCCGHGICENCYNDIKNLDKFSCPFCRKDGICMANIDYVISVSLKSINHLSYYEETSPVTKKINTLREYLQELDDNNYLSYNNNLFIVLLRQIILDNIEKK